MCTAAIDQDWEFEWQNFVYGEFDEKCKCDVIFSGCLAGLGAMIILIIMFQIVFYKVKIFTLKTEGKG